MNPKWWHNCAKGPLGELFVCMDLMEKGFEVFRAVGNFESFDLVAHKSGKLLRIQVKAGLYAQGSIKMGAQDTVAFVDLGGRSVEYDPPLTRFERRPAEEPRAQGESVIVWETADDARRILKEAGLL